MFVKIAVILQNYLSFLLFIIIYCVVLLNISQYISVSGHTYPSFLSPEINSNNIKLEKRKIKSDDKFPNQSTYSSVLGSSLQFI